MEALGIADMDKAVKALKSEVGTVKTDVNGFNSKLVDQAKAFQRTVADLNTNTATQITQISKGLELKVTQAINSLDGREIVSRINLTPAGTRIDGKLLHVTGQALFDDNIITNKMLQADSVNARNIKVNSLSSLSVNTGNLTGGSITGGTFKNANGSFKIDPNGNIVGANITASRIDAQSIYQAGFKVKSIDFKVFTVAHGEWVPTISNYGEDECTFIPIGYKMTEHGSKAKRQRRGDDTWNRIAPKRTNENCTIYFRSQDPWGVGNGDNYQAESKVGLNGRKAICQEWWQQREYDGDDGYEYWEYLNLGVLYVLVIGKK